MTQATHVPIHVLQPINSKQWLVVVGIVELRPNNEIIPVKPSQLEHGGGGMTSIQADVLQCLHAPQPVNSKQWLVIVAIVVLRLNNEITHVLQVLGVAGMM